jgi:hypothetical protein
MNELHNNGQQSESMTSMEVNPIGHDKFFARLVAAEVAANLQINFGDRDIVAKLLTSALEKQLCRHGGLLEQYLHTQLDIIAETIKFKFDINDEVGVNYGYATHAKLNAILDIIKEKYDPDQEFGTI